jgi:CHAT domain-containing protein/tetratricopeptide (TPR) repeat protein
VAGRAEEPGEVLEVGQRLVRLMATEEVQVFRAEVSDVPLLVTVEQQGVDLRVETEGSAARARTDSGLRRWGAEVVLLQEAGSYRITVRPRDLAAGPGIYAVRAEVVPRSPENRFVALALMSRAAQDAAEETPEARPRALARYREALAAWRSLGDCRWEAETLDAIAVLEAEERSLRPAAEAYLAEAEIWRELGEPLREASAWNGLGVARSYMGETGGAREALEEALALWQSLGESYDEGQTRGNLCALEMTGGSLEAARTCYQEALTFFRGIASVEQEALVLNALGGVSSLQGEPDAALEHYRQALAIYEKTGNRLGEAQALNNIGVIHRSLGEWQEALRVYGQVQEILTKLGDRFQEAILLSNVGFAYDDLGEPERALTFLQDALKLRGEVGDRRGEVITLNHLGGARRRLGDLAAALEAHRKALKLAEELGDRRNAAVSRLRITEVLLEQEAPDAALRELDPALPVLQEMGLRRFESQALLLRGRSLARAGRPAEALPVLQDVLARYRDLRDRAGEAEALYTLALAQRSLGRHDAARTNAEEALAVVEALRTHFVSPDLRAAFLATERHVYELEIDLLMEHHRVDPKGGYDQAAFEMSEQARARSLLDVLYAGTGKRAGSAVPATLSERRQSLRRRLSATADQQLKDKGSGARAEVLARDLESLRAELDNVEAEIRRLDPGYAAAAAPPHLGTRELAGLLDPGTLLVEYALGEERSFLWALDAQGAQGFVLPPRKEIEAAAREAYEKLSTVDAEAGGQNEVLERLGRILLGPVWERTAQLQRLTVVPDGALQIVPFEALRVPPLGKKWDEQSPRDFLLERLAVVYLPSATTLALERQRLEGRAPAPKWAAVFADPVFSPEDPRVAPSAGRTPAKADAASSVFAGFERLPSTRREAEQIMALAPSGQAWSALGFAANRDAVLDGGLRAYRVVHFATHGVADHRNPERSGLVLSLVDAAGRPQQGFLSLTDVYDLDLAADLVVLSGCRSAFGKAVSGEGLLGLTRGFFSAGAPRVVASLWEVQDRTTAELMTRFYRALWQEGLPAAAALREARRSLRKIPRYADPYSWAGFVLQGDWR